LNSARLVKQNREKRIEGKKDHGPLESFPGGRLVRLPLAILKNGYEESQGEKERKEEKRGKEERTSATCVGGGKKLCFKRATAGSESESPPLLKRENERDVGNSKDN